MSLLSNISNYIVSKAPECFAALETQEDLGGRILGALECLGIPGWAASVVLVGATIALSGKIAVAAKNNSVFRQIGTNEKTMAEKRAQIELNKEKIRELEQKKATLINK